MSSNVNKQMESNIFKEKDFKQTASKCPEHDDISNKYHQLSEES